jgi:parvulin-like peptidyl-prolyl isomerase
MNSYRAAAALLAAIALSSASQLSAEEPTPPVAPPPVSAIDDAPKKPHSLEEAVAGIPAEELEQGVLLQAGEIKVYLSAVEPMEKAYSAARKRRDGKWEYGPGEKLAMRKQFGVKLLANKVIEAYAAAKKLTATDAKYADVFTKFKEAKTKHGGYEQFLTDNGMSDDDFQRFLKASVAIESSLAASVTENEIAVAMLERKDDFALRRASDIMFTFKGADGAQKQMQRAKEEARKLADDLLKKLRESGGEFDKLAHEMSDSPSADAGGDLGFVPKRGGMVDVIAEAVYKIEKVGGYSEVVESPFGFHIVKLTAVKGEAETKGMVKDQLVSEKFGAEMQKLMEQTVVKAKFNAKALN